jgi:restriction endonuclease S subunit
MKREKHSALTDLCTIQVGFTNRSKLDESVSDGVPCIQQGDLNKGEDLLLKDNKRYFLDGNFDQLKVSGGEVLFRSRSGMAVAKAVPEDLELEFVVINPVMILRVKSEQLLTSYLAWAINQPWVQTQLNPHVRGSAIKMIPKSALARVQIPVPPIAKQRKIVEFSRLAEEESRLLEQLRDLREKWAEVITRQALNVEQILKGATQ